jgi:hypothetical protein
VLKKRREPKWAADQLRWVAILLLRGLSAFPCRSLTASFSRAGPLTYLDMRREKGLDRLVLKSPVSVQLAEQLF